VLVDTPRFVKAFELAKAARVAGIDARTVAWTGEWAEGFKRDKVASQMMGSWLSGHLASGWRLRPPASGARRTCRPARWRPTAAPSTASRRRRRKTQAWNSSSS
jgi:multiple sugar transport system substrate-binding protein